MGIYESADGRFLTCTYDINPANWVSLTIKGQKDTKAVVLIQRWWRRHRAAIDNRWFTETESETDTEREDDTERESEDETERESETDIESNSNRLSLFSSVFLRFLACIRFLLGL